MRIQKVRTATAYLRLDVLKRKSRCINQPSPKTLVSNVTKIHRRPQISHGTVNKEIIKKTYYTRLNAEHFAEPFPFVQHYILSGIHDSHNQIQKVDPLSAFSSWSHLTSHDLMFFVQKAQAPLFFFFIFSGLHATYFFTARY